MRERAPGGTSPGERSRGMEALKLWGPPLLLMAVIFFLSGRSNIPGPDNPFLDRVLKDIAHAIGYGLLAASYARALHGSTIRRVVPVALLLTLLYAISDEWHQTFVPGRDGNVLDVLIDLGGGIIGVTLWQCFRHRDDVDAAP